MLMTPSEEKTNIFKHNRCNILHILMSDTFIYLFFFWYVTGGFKHSYNEPF